MIHAGDLFDVLPTLDAESIDAGVTDPPYGIGFMGKEWDSFKPDVTQQMRARTVKNHKAATNPNLKGRLQWTGGAAVEYDFTAKGLRGFQTWTERWAREVYRVLKPGAHLVVCGAPRSFHRMTCGLEDAGFEIRDCLSWLYGQGFPKSLNLGDGRGTALKPGWEPIVLARKPFKGSVTANVLQHGTGALNIDASRIDANGETWEREPGTVKANDSLGTFKTGPRSVVQNDLGRWPANVVLDEEAAVLLDEQSGELVGCGNVSDIGRGRGKSYNASSYEVSYAGRANRSYGPDGGAASRFYYVAKPDREERDFGTHGLTERPRDESRKDGNPGGDNPRNRGLQPRGNSHPTVKPIALMRWLVRLITPLNGTVLDPFCGSGTTGMACRYELRQFVGIERELTYVQIAERRIGAVVPLFHGVSA